jgi:hypothetical protein
MFFIVFGVFKSSLSCTTVISVYNMTKMAALVNAEDLVDSDGNTDGGGCNC